MKGRRPKPTPLHILDGTFRADRHAAGTVQPLPGAPKCPRHFDKEEKKIWKELVAALDGTGILTHADAGAMECYCEAVALKRRAIIQLKKFAMATLVDDRIRTMVKALNVIRHGAAEEINTMGSALGLTPIARDRLHASIGPAPEGVAKRDRSKGPPPPTGATA